MSAAKVGNSEGLGARIRLWRKHSGATLDATAEKAGIHANTLSNIERGRSSPNPSTLENLAAALGQPIDVLLGATPARPPENEAVIAFLQEFRSRTPDVFEGWSESMWERFVALGLRMGISTEAAALHFVAQVRREFRSISQLLDLFDANEAEAVLVTLNSEHARFRASEIPRTVDGRVDRNHSAVSPPHSLVPPLRGSSITEPLLERGFPERSA